jgi:hypothetical protein
MSTATLAPVATPAPARPDTDVDLEAWLAGEVVVPCQLTDYWGILFFQRWRVMIGRHRCRRTATWLVTVEPCCERTQVFMCQRHYDLTVAIGMPVGCGFCSKMLSIHRVERIR